MLKITHIRKALKSFAVDPKDKSTEWHIQARDMHAMAHIQRARMLITYFIEGVRGPESLIEAGWHLACGVYKHEAVFAEEQQTARGNTARQDNKDAEDSGVERN
jgi:hypothetical protein